jgi:hypothetical protein
MKTYALLAAVSILTGGSLAAMEPNDPVDAYGAPFEQSADQSRGQANPLPSVVLINATPAPSQSETRAQRQPHKPQINLSS